MTTLGYWNIRGLGQHIRYLLAYLGVDFTNKVYTFENDDWFGKDKNGLGIDFPNLPYLIDADITLTESNVIPIYLAKKYKRLDLLGLNADGSLSEKEFRMQQVIAVVYDLRKRLDIDLYNPDQKFWDVKEKLFQERYQSTIEQLVNYLGSKQFIVGNLTIADFVLYEILMHLKHLYPTAQFPTEYLTRIENLPRVKEYIQSPKCIQDYGQ